MPDSEYMTTGDIARRIDEPLHRVTYALQRLRIIEDARAGTYRLFLRHRVPGIVERIRTIARRGSETATSMK